MQAIIKNFNQNKQYQFKILNFTKFKINEKMILYKEIIFYSK
jgi:hypothetical protein